MRYSKRYGAAMLVLAMVLFALTTVNIKAQDNWIYIYYVQTDKSTYEVGENVSITASYEVHYLQRETHAEGSTLSYYGAGQTIATEQWSNEANGTHIRRLNDTLNPSIWHPGKSGEVGTADAYLFLDYLDPINHQEVSVWQDRNVNFTVVRAKQNSSLIEVTPSHPSGNTTSILLSFRIYNGNNPSFGVGFNSVNYNITNPEGQIVSNTTKSDSAGYYSISFNPFFNFGTYRVSLRSLENANYQEGRFNYNLTVNRSPTPTTLNVTWKYYGAMFNGSSSYALEPVKITVKLASLIDGSGISDQGVSLLINDASNRTVSQISGSTNASGFLTYTLPIPSEGKFIARALYNGLYGSWRLSGKQAPDYIGAAARPVSVRALNGNPSSIYLGRNYTAKFLILDGLSGKPVPSQTFTAKIKGYSLSNGTTNDDGVLFLATQIPKDRLDFLGNSTLILEPVPGSSGRVYDSGVFSTPLLGKIPTTTVLNIPKNTIFEESDTISITTELLSLDSTPLSHENLTFMIFVDQSRDPLEVILDRTNEQGISSISVKALTHGTLTIVAIFDGSLVLNSSSDAHSITVLPRFQERLPSYLLSGVLACLFALATIMIIGKGKRKLRWRDLMMPQS